MLLVIAALATLISPWIIPADYLKAAADNDLIRAIKQKLDKYNDHFPEDRVYLQLDKPMYEPGDNIWFAAYLRNAATLKPSDKSDILVVELLNPKGTVEKKITIVAKNGKAAGDFALGDEALGGMYRIRAYTSWMKNSSEDDYFVKEIQVQDVVLPNLKMKLGFEKKAFGAGDVVMAKLELNTNENRPLTGQKIKFTVNLNGQKFMDEATETDEEGMRYIKFTLPQKLESNDGLLNVMIDYNGSTESISRSIPIVLNTVKLGLYPEGGDLVCGLANNVGFSAKNEFDKPADIEGIVVNGKGSKVASFSSFHQGMGAFNFTPQTGEAYKIKITKPAGIAQTFDLPDALDRGYVMTVNAAREGELGVNIATTETGELSLIAQVRGKIYYSAVVNPSKGESKFVFSTKELPIGVCQLTLFDSKGIARAERLAFVNSDRQMNISVKAEKEKYLPREKVKMTITVKDERGLPMPANLSMAVVNDQALAFADDKSGNILSQLLLQQDVKGKIEEPAFYFNKKEAKSAKALDYLLMTAGWRRFTWEQVMNGDMPAIKFPGQKAIVNVSVLDQQTNKPVACAKIKTPDGHEFITDEQGKYTIKGLDLSQPQTLLLSADEYVAGSQTINDYSQNLLIYLYSKKYYEQISYQYNNYASRSEDNVQMKLNAPMALQHVQVVKAANKNFKTNAAKKNVAAAKPAKSKEIEKLQEEARDVNVGTKDQEGKNNLVLPPVMQGALAAIQEVDDVRDFAFARKNKVFVPAPAAVAYYRARQFAAPDYSQQETVETRTDFRDAIYWDPDLEIGFSGKKTIEFYTSDNITSFRATVEGIGSDGAVGRAESTFFTQLPFAMSVKIPVEVATEDLISIPLTLKNNTAGPLGGALTITAPEGLQQISATASVQTIMPGAAKTIYLDYKVLDRTGYGNFNIAFKSCGLGDAFTQRIKIAPKGFPSHVSFSSQDKEKEYTFEVDHLVKGSLKASFTAFPNIVADLVKGVEGILQEPYGCFEQTSCTAYPNAMVLDYLRNTGSKDTKTLARATDLLDRGYTRLTTFETSGKGYEWFGANPAHEGLTAYGVMEFTDMKRAGQAIDEKMMDRTSQWLLGQRDGKGGFKREQRALHDFGRISNDVLNGYIVYALADAGYTGIKKEFETAHAKALASSDPYLLAMSANAAYALKENKMGDEALKILSGKQQKDGSFNGLSHSITYSEGQSLIIETTALSVLAILKSPDKNPVALNHAVHYLVGARSGSGVFSSSQGTILALKALTEFAKFSKRIAEDGTVVIYVDDKKVAEKKYKAGENGEIVVDQLEQYIKGEGRHTLKVKYQDVKTPLPYSVAVNWSTTLPVSDKECTIDIQTKLALKTVRVGETVRLATKVTNKKNANVPSVIAIIGIPAGFTAQPWQLKEMQEKGVFDYYEIKGNNIAVYYRGMGAASVKDINLDLKAEMPGEYDAPASTAYLYYTNEFKTWAAADKIIIRKNL